MTKRLWWTGPGGVEALTDEKALERILRGDHIQPLQGEAKLIATIASELETVPDRMKA